MLFSNSPSLLFSPSFSPLTLPRSLLILFVAARAHLGHCARDESERAQDLAVVSSATRVIDCRVRGILQRDIDEFFYFQYARCLDTPVLDFNDSMVLHDGHLFLNPWDERRRMAATRDSFWPRFVQFTFYDISVIGKINVAYVQVYSPDASSLNRHISAYCLLDRHRTSKDASSYSKNFINVEKYLMSLKLRQYSDVMIIVAYLTGKRAQLILNVNHGIIKEHF